MSNVSATRPHRRSKPVDAGAACVPPLRSCMSCVVTPPLAGPKPIWRILPRQPPSVHQMVLTLERAGFIRRQPKIARSIERLIDPNQLPDLL